MVDVMKRVPVTITIETSLPLHDTRPATAVEMRKTRMSTRRLNMLLADVSEGARRSFPAVEVKLRDEGAAEPTGETTLFKHTVVAHRTLEHATEEKLVDLHYVGQRHGKEMWLTLRIGIRYVDALRLISNRLRVGRFAIVPARFGRDQLPLIESLLMKEQQDNLTWWFVKDLHRVTAAVEPEEIALDDDDDVEVEVDEAAKDPWVVAVHADLSDIIEDEVWVHLYHAVRYGPGDVRWHLNTSHILYVDALLYVNRQRTGKYVIMPTGYLRRRLPSPTGPVMRNKRNGPVWWFLEEEIKPNPVEPVDSNRTLMESIRSTLELQSARLATAQEEERRFAAEMAVLLSRYNVRPEPVEETVTDESVTLTMGTKTVVEMRGTANGGPHGRVDVWRAAEEGEWERIVPAIPYEQAQKLLATKDDGTWLVAMSGSPAFGFPAVVRSGPLNPFDTDALRFRVKKGPSTVDDPPQPQMGDVADAWSRYMEASRSADQPGTGTRDTRRTWSFAEVITASEFALACAIDQRKNVINDRLQELVRMALEAEKVEEERHRAVGAEMTAAAVAEKGAEPAPIIDALWEAPSNLLMEPGVDITAPVGCWREDADGRWSNQSSPTSGEPFSKAANRAAWHPRARYMATKIFHNADSVARVAKALDNEGLCDLWVHNGREYALHSRAMDPVKASRLCMSLGHLKYLLTPVDEPLKSDDIPAKVES